MMRKIKWIFIIFTLGSFVMCQSGQTTQPPEEKKVEENIAKETNIKLYDLGKDLSFVYAPYGKGWAYKDVSIDNNDFNKWYSTNKREILKVIDAIDAGFVLEVVGHTDASGPQEAEPATGKKGNLWYSQERANRVCESLIKAGIPKDKLRCIGVGENELIPGINPLDRKHRRVTFRVNRK